MITACQSEKIRINGANIHYLTAGVGKPVVFLHGIPGSSTMWADIIPAVASRGRCIAPDFIGMGESDKPKITYSLDDQVHFLKGFIDALNLNDFVLVMNRWGSIIGLEYASRYGDKVNISGLVFTEAYLRIEKNLQEVPLIFEKLKVLKQTEPDKLKHMLTQAFWRVLEEEPYINPKSSVVKTVENYSTWLEKTPIRKLLLYTAPGFLTTQATVKWATTHMANITAIDLGINAQEASGAMPVKFSESLLSWL